MTGKPKSLKRKYSRNWGGARRRKDGSKPHAGRPPQTIRLRAGTQLHLDIFDDTISDAVQRALSSTEIKATVSEIVRDHFVLESDGKTIIVTRVGQNS